MNNLEDYIITVDNAVTPALCDAVLNEYKETEEWRASLNSLGTLHLDRQCSSIGISFDSVIQKNTKVRKDLDNYLYIAAANALKQYVKLFPAATIEQDSGYDLLRYEVGQHYKQHTDFFKNTPRVVSCSFMLNDDYEGGEFAFFDRELVYKLKKGSCIMFPSNFTYPHEIMPVTSGTRYSIVTWFM
jgi:predicted 2-oxoglutarate/Fe(II)-dependent dioxygenase YbiX